MKSIRYILVFLMILGILGIQSYGAWSWSDSSKSGFSSTSAIISAVKKSDSSMNIYGVGWIKSLGKNKFVSMIASELISYAVPEKGKVFAKNAFILLDCLNKKGVYDGIFYYSMKNGYPSFGLVIVIDRNEIMKPGNYLSCLDRVPPMSMVPSYQIKACSWTIQNRFDIVYLSLTDQGNNVEYNVCSSLGGCSGCQTVNID